MPAPDRPDVELVWVEEGGPNVVAPKRKGFGTLVIERNLARSAEADVELTFPPQGVRCRVTILSAQLLGHR